MTRSKRRKLEAALNNLLDAGSHALIENLTETAYINNGGLRCLVSVWRKARQQDSNLALWNEKQLTSPL